MSNLRTTRASGNLPKTKLDQLKALHSQGKLEDALSLALALKADFPNSAVLHNILGVAQSQLELFNEAIESYQHAINLKPDFAAAFNNLGNAFREKGEFDKAFECFNQALEIKPNFAEAHNNLGNVFKSKGSLNKAIPSYRRAIELKPKYQEAHYNLGFALKEIGDFDNSVICYKNSLALKPDHAEAYNNLGITLGEKGALDEEVACYQRALDLKPDFASVLAQKLYIQAQMCDWSLWPEFEAVAQSIGIKGDCVNPYALLALEDDPARHRLRSEKYALEQHLLTKLPLPDRPRHKPEKLRIAYVSGDFHSHPVTYLMADLYRAHDRKHFEVFAYSLGDDNKDLMRDKVVSNVDRYREVKNLTDEEIAVMAQRDGIHVVVDLQGYTKYERTGIFALRAAPVQISYLGYPGTMGTNSIDYIIADEIVIPAQQRQHYAENIIYLPHSYQASDDTRVISDRAMHRSEFNLPEEAFVFCCFNNNYKISPREFDIWMRLLDRVEGSVLWLSRSNKWAEENLLAQAQSRGINAERLIFAGRLDQIADHLARLRLADLFLDTFNYNAHATASDALWTGLPIVTKPGKGFAARVSASLLTAIGLPELITQTEAEYEALALDLALHPDKLGVIRQKLAENRQTQPLFNTELFARHIEDAYQQAYDLFFEGKNPQTIRVSSQWQKSD
jgi:predicted O-linked N-acetylglucosamine transferase (SPINDLY family)